MTAATPPVLYISADTSDLTTRYKATPRMHMGADAWIPRDAVRVKPLEWGRDADVGCFYAGPSWLEYEIYEETDGTCNLQFPGATVGRYHTLEAAKAAAQADFEARIMSALAALPAPDEGEQEEGA